MRWLLWVVGSLMLALLFLGISLFVHPALAAVAPLPVIAGLMVVFRPFFGVFVMVLFTQMDAVLDVLTPGLPGMKLLAAGTFIGLILKFVRGARPVDLGLQIPAIKVAVIFTLWIGVSSLFSHNLGATAESLARLIPLLMLFYLIVMLADDIAKIRLLIVALLVSTLISGTITVLDSFIGEPLFSTHHSAVDGGWEGHSRSAGATNYDPTTAAAMLLTGVAHGAVVAILGTHVLRWLAIGSVIGGSVGIVFSLARSASLGLGLVVCWFLYRFRNPKLIAAVIIFSPIAFVVFLQVAPEYYVDRLLTLIGVGSQDFTLDRRMTYQIIGLDLLLQHPIFGVGLGNFPHFYMNFEYRWLDGRTLTPRLLHNMPLSMFVETGLIGGSLFLALIFTSLWPAWKILRQTVQRTIRLCIEATLTAASVLLLMSLTLPLQYNKYVWGLLGISLAISRIEQRQKKLTSSQSIESSLNQ